MRTNLQFSADLFSCTEEVFNGRLHFSMHFLNGVRKSLNDFFTERRLFKIISPRVNFVALRRAK